MNKTVKTLLGVAAFLATVVGVIYALDKKKFLFKTVCEFGDTLTDDDELFCDEDCTDDGECGCTCTDKADGKQTEESAEEESDGDSDEKTESEKSEIE